MRNIHVGNFTSPNHLSKMTNYSLNRSLGYILGQSGDYANLSVVCLGLAYWSDRDLRAVGAERVVVENPGLQPLPMNKVF